MKNMLNVDSNGIDFVLLMLIYFLYKLGQSLKKLTRDKLNMRSK